MPNIPKQNSFAKTCSLTAMISITGLLALTSRSAKSQSLLEAIQAPSPQQKAFLTVHQGPAIAEEFQEILENRGIDLFRPPYLSSSRKQVHQGSGGSYVSHFINPTVQQFFAELFTTLAAISPHHLSPTDLFHGHIYYSDSRRGLFVLFHAKEYPYDLPGYEHYQASFSTSDPAYRYRNIIYDLSSNRYHILDLNPPSAFLDPYAYPPGSDRELKSLVRESVELVKTIQGDYFLSEGDCQFVGDLNLMGDLGLFLTRTHR